ncbi:MAG: AraC family transcriptional regulator [Oscillospiraceae bacterium]|nr:AraC family transcriptional regulator [Oscillospiraceae bacterium]
MDFSFLDKKEYKNIPLLDESAMCDSPDAPRVFIRKYSKYPTDKDLHRHTYIQINYVNRGKGVHIINNKRIDIAKGDVFIIPPYVPHVIFPGDNDNLEIFEFEFSVDFVLPAHENIEDAASYLDFAYLEPFIVMEEQVKPSFTLNEKAQIKIESILNEALREFEERSPGYLLVVKALLLKLLVITGREFSSEIRGTEFEKILNKYKKIVSAAMEYIQLNYNKNISLKELSDEVNYSRSRFSYLFKSVAGQTFVEYLNSVRIDRAIDLLNNSDKSITDISYEVGFNTISNFNKTFKHLTGYTPRNYRKNIK